MTQKTIIRHLNVIFDEDVTLSFIDTNTESTQVVKSYNDEIKCSEMTILPALYRNINPVPVSVASDKKFKNMSGPEEVMVS